jgi:Ran GTPase-activating protein (RanGAP) involved in mRNA processing and transport
MIQLKAIMRAPNKHSFRKLNLPVTSTFHLKLQFAAKLNRVDPINSLNVEKLLDLYVARCADNSINYLPKQAARFIEKIRKNSKNGILNLSESQLGPNSSIVLRRILIKNENFTQVNLGTNSLSQRGIAIISKAFQMNDTIIHLNLSSNDIPAMGAKKLFKALARN